MRQISLFFSLSLGEWVGVREGVWRINTFGYSAKVPPSPSVPLPEGEGS